MAVSSLRQGQTAELGPDLAGAGVVAAVEYGQGLPPRVAGRLRVTDGALAVAQVREHDRLGVVVGELPEQAEGALVARDGLPVLAEVVMGVPDAVQGASLAGTRADFAMQVESLLTVGEGLVMLKVPGLAVSREAGIITRSGGWLSPAALHVIEELKVICAAEPEN